MAAGSGSGREDSIFSLSVRQIVIAGILGGIAIFLGATQFGYIPVPNVSGRATILHIPAIVGGALEGPVVGALAGLIFGIFSWLDPVVPPLRNPLVSVLPRIPIGIVSWIVFVSLRRTSVDLASLVADLLDSFANPVPVLDMPMLLEYFPLAVFLLFLPHPIADSVLAPLLT